MLDVIAQLSFSLVTELSSALWILPESFWKLLNSNFSAALLGALVAWLVSDRSYRRRELVAEIRATISAINVSFDIINLFLSLKAQHTVDLVNNYRDLRTKILDDRASAMSSEVGGAKNLEFQVDYRRLELPPTSVEILQAILFDRVSIGGRALLAFATLNRSIHELTQVTRLRNEIIAQCMKMPPRDQQIVHIFLGIPDSHGRTDARYQNCMDAIEMKTDDCIFFGQVLMNELIAHGQARAAEFGKRAPAIPKPDFSKAKNAGLLPDQEKYKEWLEGFKPRVVAEKFTSWSSWFDSISA